MKSTAITFGLLIWSTVGLFSQNADTLDIDIAKGEYWWGGLSTEGHNTPYDSHSKVTHDLWANNEGNQAQLKLTTQYYFTPKNRRIHRGELGPEDKSWGLLPDLEVPVAQRRRWELSRAESDREMERLKAKARNEAHEVPEQLHLEDPQVRAAFTHVVEQLGAELPQAVADAARVTSAQGVAPVETNTASVAPVESETPAEGE